MISAVLNLKVNKRQKLKYFLITLYILNIMDLICTKFLLWKAPDVFMEMNIFLKPIIQGKEPYFIKIGLMAIILVYWYFRSEKSNVTQMKRSILAATIAIAGYVLINIIHIVNLYIYLFVI